MKNIITLLLCFSVTFLHTQVQEGDFVRFQFIKVEEDKIDEFESYMINFTGPAAEAAVSEGKMENWLLRRVAKNARYNAGFSHIAIWVATNPDPSWTSVWEKAYPNLSADARSWIYGKGEELYSTVYNASCEYITGFFRDPSKIPDVAIFNLIKTKKYNAYIDMEVDAKDIFEEYAKGLEGWHVMKRRGVVAKSEGAWDMITIDLFDTWQKANQNWWSDVPAKVSKKHNEKHGSDLREIRHRVMTRLLFDARTGKKDN
ncbi:MAG: hypothetical protein DBW74_01115 [Cryomorphaceae bacterium]|nr:MAG: hypothetical protein DBW74_01115 [Cryomorphaceae bacterium]|tara:strand:- start:741 stop:1514 length:774 start_codon:yes stop_codon:yes gene_type:complete